MEKFEKLLKISRHCESEVAKNMLTYEVQVHFRRLAEQKCYVGIKHFRRQSIEIVLRLSHSRSHLHDFF